jgi:membrane dipeptidase
MSHAKRRVLLVAAAAAALAGVLFFGVLARVVSARMNRVRQGPAPLAVSERAARLHATLRIADLHDDVLLWDRDPLPRSSHGHTDVARLQEGNVAVELFSTVTKTPRGQNYEANSGASDNITLLAVASRWPPRTWGSLLERALHEAAKLRRAAAESGGRLVLAGSRDELAAALAARAAQPPGQRAVIGILATEGLQVLEGHPERLDTLFAAGFRYAGLTHFFDNEVAGSAHGIAKGGLTAEGREVLRRMERLRLLVDLAHASPRTVDDVLAVATRPVLFSHGGVQAVCPGPRNLTDVQLRRLAANGALVGIGFWDAAACDISPRGIARSIRHAVEVMGPDHVALGSDWDGATTVAIDAAHLARLTQALLDEGLSEDEVRAVMGENAIRFLLANLP